METKLKLMLGELLLTNANLAAQLEAMTAERNDLKAKLDAKEAK